MALMEEEEESDGDNDFGVNKCECRHQSIFFLI